MYELIRMMGFIALEQPKEFVCHHICQFLCHVKFARSKRLFSHVYLSQGSIACIEARVTGQKMIGTAELIFTSDQKELFASG